MTRTLLDSRPLSVVDYRCDIKPGDEPFRGIHGSFTIAYVRRGSFGYHAHGQSTELVTGSILVGYPGDEYLCTHDHSFGDECLAFQLPDSVLETFKGGCKPWLVGGLPPVSELMVLGELAQAAADGRSDIGLDEAGMLLTARFLEIIGQKDVWATRGDSRDRRRAIESAYWIDAHLGETVDLERAAQQAGLSAFHFLRMFVGVLGVTPHQYLVRSRLRRAARLLADGATSITGVAGDVGFADVSNFVRTFRRAARMSPGDFRRAARGDRKILQDRLAVGSV